MGLFDRSTTRASGRRSWRRVDEEQMMVSKPPCERFAHMTRDVHKRCAAGRSGGDFSQPGDVCMGDVRLHHHREALLPLPILQQEVSIVAEIRAFELITGVLPIDAHPLAEAP